MEAMLAAAYLDGGIGQVQKLIHRLVLDQEQGEDRRRPGL